MSDICELVTHSKQTLRGVKIRVELRAFSVV